MMAKIYGVCPKGAASHKGYRDAVQQTDPMISGQLRSSPSGAQTLRGSLRDAQTLQVTFGYPQNQAAYSQLANYCCNQLILHIYNDSLELSKLLILPISVRGTELPDSPILSTSTNGESWPNLLIFPKTCDAGSRETKLGDSPSLKTLMKASSCTPGAQKEKDNAANVALWNDCFFSHQENQYIAVLQHSFSSLRGEVNCLLTNIIGKQNHTEVIGETYENFVVSKVVYRNSVLIRTDIWRRTLAESQFLLNRILTKVSFDSRYAFACVWIGGLHSSTQVDADYFSVSIFAVHAFSIGEVMSGM